MSDREHSQDSQHSEPDEHGQHSEPDERHEGTRETGQAGQWTDPVREPAEPRPARPTGRHAVNIGHLVMGLAFLCFVGAWALVQTDVVTGDGIRWLLPLPWLVAGAIGLGAVAVSSARRHGVRR